MACSSQRSYNRLTRLVQLMEDGSFIVIIIIIIIIIINGSACQQVLGHMENNLYSSLCSIDKLSFPSFSISGFLLQLPLSSSVSQIIQELCSCSSYSFLFRHLSFKGIVKKVISSSNMTNPDIIQKRPLLSCTFQNIISYFL